MKVENEIKVYEIDGEETGLGKSILMKISSHWNRSSYVIIKINNKEYTVLASELSKAIENATNWRNY